MRVLSAIMLSAALIFGVATTASACGEGKASASKKECSSKEAKACCSKDAKASKACCKDKKSEASTKKETKESTAKK